jgi:putative ABC transport system substrate-binding protein
LGWKGREAIAAALRQSYPNLRPTAESVVVHVNGLVVPGNTLFENRRVQLVTLAAHHRLPAIYGFRAFAEIGGLMSYGPNFAAYDRILGIYAGRILKGEKSADLPVEQATRFEFVINTQTARALGLTVPPTLLALADEVIE